MKKSDQKLRDCLMAASKIDAGRLDEEMKYSEPHVFSQEFEEKMMKVEKIARQKPIAFRLKQFGAVAAVLLVMVGVVVIGTEYTTATKPGFNIITWAKEYFTFNSGEEKIIDGSFKFEESQIGYIPEGFVKTGEVNEATFSQYEFRNESKEHIIFRVYSISTAYAQDGDVVDFTIKKNLAGYDYAYAFKKDEGIHTLIWEDARGYSYRLSGNAPLEEMEMMMEGIN